MKRAYLAVALALTLSSCTSEEYHQTYQGIGTVERSDTMLAIHYYDRTFILQNASSSGLEDDERIEFQLVTTEEVTYNSVYKANLNYASDDLTLPIVHLDTATVNERYKATASLTPSIMHMPRDFRRNDYFNITTYFSTRDDNDDYVCLTLEPEEQIADTTDLIVLWLRHFQRSSESPTHYGYSTISVPLNELKQDSLERVTVRVKRITAEADTAVTDYTYSYVNFNEYGHLN